MPTDGYALSHQGVLKQLEYNFWAILFQVMSILTTTGFGTSDIGGPFFGYVAKQLFLIMMVIGGCIGSTGGGIKVLRVAILIRILERDFVPGSELMESFKLIMERESG